ncbi:MAG: hypothetical protein ACW98I_15155 [Candidatus Hodarchaeales archaeon]|jgi:hypothetical protein
MNSNQKINLIDDESYTGGIPALFKVKRKSNGAKWEIKDENKKKVMQVKNELAGLRKQRQANQLAKDAYAGKRMEVPLYTLQDAKKATIGEISVVTNFPEAGFCTTKINNISGNTLATLQAPSQKTNFIYYLISFTKTSPETEYPKLYQIETKLDSFHLAVTQKISNFLGLKAYSISDISILDSRDEKCLSLVHKRGKFETTLYQEMSLLVANSLAILFATAIWPPTKKSH